jgi:hypothetical protein
MLQEDDATLDSIFTITVIHQGVLLDGIPVSHWTKLMADMKASTRQGGPSLWGLGRGGEGLPFHSRSTNQITKHVEPVGDC